MGEDTEDLRARVHALVRQSPRGQVATYGQIAALAGHARAARAVGAILRATGGELPWHRVINAQGRVSHGGDLFRPEHQRLLLEAEGVRFRRSGACDLDQHGWDGPADPLPWE
jgi:methylated-DNA-protein-cysteine methyltransferase-like protein